MKKNLFLAGLVMFVLVGSLIALDTYVEDFTLFPNTNGHKIDDNSRAASKVDPKKAEPEIIADEGERKNTSDADGGAAPSNTNSKKTIPLELEGDFTPNKSFNVNKKLKVAKGQFYTINNIIKKKVKTPAKYIGETYCPAMVANFKNKIELRFRFSDNALTKQILFLVVENKIGKYYFKPQSGVNILVFPHQFKPGQHDLQYGYILKKDASKLEVPFYALDCSVWVEK